MKFVVIAQHDPNIFPGMHQIACMLGEAGHDVAFLSTIEPTRTGCSSSRVEWVRIPHVTGLFGRIPFVRSNFFRVFRYLLKARPDWVIAQHEYIVPSTIAHLATRGRLKVAACFVDFHGERRYVAVLKRLASRIDAYVDICDLRVEWRRAAWPRMVAETFVVRNAPSRQALLPMPPHSGAARVVFTSSGYILGLDRDRLSRFLSRLCANGISVDWYFPETGHARDVAGSLVEHPLFTLHPPIDKPRLLGTLAEYDVGLHWAPMVEQDYDRDYFLSAASNKIGEYIAAGLAVAYAGNPGLAYMPGSMTLEYDPTDPEAGADQLAAALADRGDIERLRQAALRYHHEEMNFQDQVAPLVDFLLKDESVKA